MFPTLRQRLGDALDLVVEFSTLGEYRLGVQDAPLPSGAPPAAGAIAPGMGGAGLSAGRAPGRRTVAGPAGRSPAATPAARRRAGDHPHRVALQAPGRRARVRAGQPAAPDQHCLARD
ncbi:MAG: hypothetical protein ABR581_09375 [Thermoleophilaceae bacterium]